MLPKHRPPTPPGEMLRKEFLEPMGISQRALARHLGWTYAKLNKIINGNKGITAGSSLSLAEAFGIEPDFWLNLQCSWDLWNAMRQHKKVKRIKTA